MMRAAFGANGTSLPAGWRLRTGGPATTGAPIAKVGNSPRGRFPKPARAIRWRGLLLWASFLGWPVFVQAADVIQGASLYRQHCAACHGTNGRPPMVGAPDFTQPTALLKPDMTLLQSIRSGKGAMPAYQGLLRDSELLDIVAHLRTLR